MREGFCCRSELAEGASYDTNVHVVKGLFNLRFKCYGLSNTVGSHEIQPSDRLDWKHVGVPGSAVVCQMFAVNALSSKRHAAWGIDFSPRTSREAVQQVGNDSYAPVHWLPSRVQQVGAYTDLRNVVLFQLRTRIRESRSNASPSSLKNNLARKF